MPKLSLANGLVYVYTKEPQTDGDDLWYLTALDFRTGRTVFKRLSGEGLGYNNNYAPISLGPDGSAYVGVLGGLVRLADASPPPGAGPVGAPPADARPLRRPCQPRRLAVQRAGIGLVVLNLESRYLRFQGARVGRRSARLCVEGGGRMAAALDRRGRVRLVVSSAPGHRYRRIGARVPTRLARRAFPRRRRVAPGVYATDRSRRVLFAVRGRRVVWVAVARRDAVRRRTTIRRALRAAGFGAARRSR